MANRRVVLIMATAALLFYGGYRLGWERATKQATTPVTLSFPTPPAPSVPMVEITNDYMAVAVKRKGKGLSVSCMNIGENGISPNWDNLECQKEWKLHLR